MTAASVGGDAMAEVMADIREVIAAAGWMLPDDLRRTRVLSPELAALYLDISTHTLRWWRWHGTGPSYLRIARNRVGYLVADLDAYIDARRVEPANRS